MTSHIWSVSIIAAVVGIFLPGNELQNELFHQLFLPILLSLFTGIIIYYLTTYKPKLANQFIDRKLILDSLNPNFKLVDYKVKNIRKEMVTLSKYDTSHYKDCLKETIGENNYTNEGKLENFITTFEYNDELLKFDQTIFKLYFQYGSPDDYDIIKTCYSKELNSEIFALYQEIKSVLDNYIYQINGTINSKEKDTLISIMKGLKRWVEKGDEMPSLIDLREFYWSMNNLNNYLLELNN